MTGPRVELSAAPACFIGAWYLEDFSVCDDLVRLYQSSPHKTIGSTTNRYGEAIVNSDKESLELAFRADSAEAPFQEYVRQLQKVIEKYIAEFPWCNEYAAWTIVERVNLQFYPRGGGFGKFHTERMSATMPNAARHLVFMTYLNDVHDAGGTEFLHQRLTVSARKGLTLIWPADWTHTHRGVISATEEKYIITGWFNFVLNR